SVRGSLGCWSSIEIATLCPAIADLIHPGSASSSYSASAANSSSEGTPAGNPFSIHTRLPSVAAQSAGSPATRPPSVARGAAGGAQVRAVETGLPALPGQVKRQLEDGERRDAGGDFVTGLSDRTRCNAGHREPASAAGT